VRQTMAWQPLHMAAMAGEVSLIRELVQKHGCDLLARSANSWTPLHYAAAYNQVRGALGPEHRDGATARRQQQPRRGLCAARADPWLVPRDALRQARQQRRRNCATSRSAVKRICPL